MASSSKEAEIYARSGLSMELEKDLVTIIFYCLDVSFEGTESHKINWNHFKEFFESKYSVSARNLYIDVIEKKFPEANGIIGINGFAEDVARQCAIDMGFGFTTLKAEIKSSNHKGMEATYQIRFPDELRGRKVVIIDDVLTHGSRMKDAVKLCTNVGVEVVGAVVLIETRQGGRGEIGDTPFVSIIDLSSVNSSFWESYFNSSAK